MTNLTKLANQIITLRGMNGRQEGEALLPPISKAALIQKIGSRHTGAECETIQKMHDLALDLGAECHPLRRKAGARHSHADQELVQRMHDDCAGLGAACKALPVDEVYSRQVMKDGEIIKAQSDAPNYRAASTPQRCKNCKHLRGDPGEDWCDLFNFVADQDYVCDDWVAQRPDEIPGYSGISRKGGITRSRDMSLELKDWNNSSLSQRKGRDAVNNAIKAGILKKASTKKCFKCRKRPGAEYHHIDGYTEGQKLNVRPVCNRCHAKITYGTEANKGDLAALTEGILILRGGRASGNWGHLGRKGQKGGSGGGGGFKRIGVKPGASRKQVKRAAKKAKGSGKATSASKPQAKPKVTTKKVTTKKPLAKPKSTAPSKANESDFNTGSKKLDDILGKAGGASQADFNNHLMGKMANGEIDMKEAQTLNAHYSKAKSPKKKTKEEIKAAEKSWEVEGDSAHKNLVSDTKNWHNGLSTAENAALVSYSGNDYGVINSNLRKGKKGSQADTIKNIDAALAKSALKKDLTVYRGVEADDLGKLLGSDNPADWVGKGYQDKGYMSTSASRSGAFPGVTLEMRLPKGTKGGYLGNLKGGKHSGKDGGEKEFLIPRGKKVVIKKIVWGEAGFDGKEGVEKVIAELVDE